MRSSVRGFIKSAAVVRLAPVCITGELCVIQVAVNVQEGLRQVRLHL